VAAASIIARATFVRELDRLSADGGVRLPKGSGAEAKEAAIELNEYKNIAKVDEDEQFYLGRPTKCKLDINERNVYSMEKCKNSGEFFENIEKSNCTVYLDSNKLIEPELLLKSQSLTPPEIQYEIETMNKNINIEKALKLKCGSLVMCTFNIDLENGICNGSQGIIIDFKENSENPDKKMPVVLFSNGQKRVISYQYYQNDEYPTIVIAQIPLCLAWALTIHKIQGATLEMADMDLGKSVFEYGQSYVALSRIKSLDGLYLSEFHPHRIKANPIVKEFYNGLLTEYPDIIDTATTDSNGMNDTVHKGSNMFQEYACVDTTVKIIKI
jgi:hypothetical protein